MAVSLGHLEKNLGRRIKFNKRKRVKIYIASDLQLGPGSQHQPQIDVVSDLQVEVSLKFGGVVFGYTQPVDRDQEN